MTRARYAKKKYFDWLPVLAVVVPVLAIVSAKTVTGFIDDRKLADKPYVDERFIETRRYTDEKAAAIMKEAFEHSDRNRQDMMLKMEQINSETKTNHSILSTKMDLLLSNLQVFLGHVPNEKTQTKEK